MKPQKKLFVDTTRKTNHLALTGFDKYSAFSATSIRITEAQREFVSIEAYQVAVHALKQLKHVGDTLTAALIIDETLKLLEENN